MPERPKGVDSKSTVSLWHRGFESLSLRHFIKRFVNLPFHTLANLFPKILVDTMEFSLKENLWSKWLQFYADFLVIMSWWTEYPYLKEDVRRRALAEAEGKRGKPLPEDDWKRIEVKLALLMPKLVEDFPILLRRTTLVMVVSCFETLLADSIREIMLARPDLITVSLGKRQKKDMTSPKEIVQTRINKQLNALNSLKQKLDFIKNEPFHVQLNFPSYAETAIYEIDAARDLILHGGCLVNRRYLDKVKNSRFKIGDERPIDDAYVVKSSNTLYNASLNVHEGFEKRFVQPSVGVDD
jgi:uncharacterized membrane protein